MTYELPTLIDDDLISEEIGSWGEEKYRLLSLYSQIFAASMRTNGSAAFTSICSLAVVDRELRGRIRS
jgi:hypothetical protein